MVIRPWVWFWIGVDSIKRDFWALAEVYAVLGAILVTILFVIITELNSCWFRGSQKEWRDGKEGHDRDLVGGIVLMMVSVLPRFDKKKNIDGEITTDFHQIVKFADGWAQCSTQHNNLKMLSKQKRLYVYILTVFTCEPRPRWSAIIDYPGHFGCKLRFCVHCGQFWRSFCQNLPKMIWKQQSVHQLITTQYYISNAIFGDG